MEQKRPELEGKNILVTGGAGFIGSNLVDGLAPWNRVTVLDNLSAGSLANLEKSKKQITFIKGDILDKKLLTDIAAEVEYVFHLAGNVGNLKSIQDPSFDMQVNIQGTINLLEACLKSKIKRLVYSASGAIFGEAKYLPIDEEHPVNPESPYGVSKLAAEKYCLAFYHIHRLPTTAVRYFNVYGPRQGSSGYANVIPIFFNRIREGKPLTIFGDGKQSRDFVFVGDVVQANILAATQPAAIGQIFNIATGQATDVNQLVSIINRVSRRENQVIYAEPRAGEVRHSKANIEKARRILGYVPRISLEEGVALTWQAEIKKYRKGEKWPKF